MRRVSLLLGAAVTGILSGATAIAATQTSDGPTSPTTDTVKCYGVNACNGQGMGGKNQCKGKGLIQTSQEDCVRMGGKIESPGTLPPSEHRPS